MTARRVAYPAALAALGSLIAARRPEIGVHVIECGPGSFDIVLRMSGPHVDREAALHAARMLERAVVQAMPPGPPNTIGRRNPRPPVIVPVLPRRRNVK